MLAVWPHQLVTGQGWSLSYSAHPFCTVHPPHLLVCILFHKGSCSEFVHRTFVLSLLWLQTSAPAPQPCVRSRDSLPSHGPGARPGAQRMGRRLWGPLGPEPPWRPCENGRPLTTIQGKGHARLWAKRNCSFASDAVIAASTEIWSQLKEKQEAQESSHHVSEQDLITMPASTKTLSLPSWTAPPSQHVMGHFFPWVHTSVTKP